MVAQSRGYYGPAFQVFLGVKQCYPLYPNIFNVVVDTSVRHWVAVMVEKSGGKEGRGR